MLSISKECIRKTVDNPGPAIRNIMAYGEMRISERKGNQNCVMRYAKH